MKRKTDAESSCDVIQSASKRVGRKPNRDKVKIDPGEGLRGRFVAPELLESVCSPYLNITGEEEDAYTCDLCGYVAKERIVLINHIASQHLDLMTIKCNICDHLGNDLYKMEKHMNGHGYTREKDKVRGYFYKKFKILCS